MSGGKCKKCGEYVPSNQFADHKEFMCLGKPDPNYMPKDPQRVYAKNLIHDTADILDKRKTHGNLDEDFSTTAHFWSAYLDVPISRDMVAQMMVLLKISRTKAEGYVEDNYTDQIGYSGIAAALAYPRNTQLANEVKEEEYDGADNVQKVYEELYDKEDYVAMTHSVQRKNLHHRLGEKSPANIAGQAEPEK